MTMALLFKDQRIVSRLPFFGAGKERWLTPWPRGAFLIAVLASSDEGLEFRIDHVPIEILAREDEQEHVRFWKSKGKEQTDFLPELIKKTEENFE